MRTADSPAHPTPYSASRAYFEADSENLGGWSRKFEHFEGSAPCFQPSSGRSIRYVSTGTVRAYAMSVRVIA
eukprot:2523849-Rhodomonas_salina.3